MLKRNRDGCRPPWTGVIRENSLCGTGHRDRPPTIRGAISTLPPDCIERQLVEVEAGGGCVRDGQAFLNHQHPNPSLCASRAGVRLCLDMVWELGTALQSGWPDVHFEIFCGLGQDYVTFYQVEADPSVAEIRMGEVERSHSAWTDADELAWCDECGRDRPFLPIAEPDPEFPMLPWCRCGVCGYENVVGWRRITFRAGPGIAQDFRVGAYVPQLGTPCSRVGDRRML